MISTFAQLRHLPSVKLQERITNNGGLMPTISMFYGIIIRMYCAPGEHNPPHIHAYYQDYKAIVDIQTCEITEGKLPGKQTKLVLAWAEIHNEELIADWELASNGELPFKIEPLN